MNFILILIVGVACFTGISWGLDLKRLKNHVGMTGADFVAHFQSSGIGAQIAVAVYEHFQKMGIWKDFMPSPTDGLEQIYKTADEDVEEDLMEILQRVGLEMPHSGVLRKWERNIETLSDVVLFVHWVETEQNSPNTSGRLST